MKYTYTSAMATASVGRASVSEQAVFLGGWVGRWWPSAPWSWRGTARSQEVLIPLYARSGQLANLQTTDHACCLCAHS